MSPLFADGINIGIVFVVGISVLVPLMAFEVFAEAFVLKKVWRLPFQELCSLTFFANCWSLLMGIPTKILNAYLYSLLLPQDIPGFFARYPLAIALGSLIYFIVTVLVESAYAFRWARRKQAALSQKQIWRGVLLANIATYAVLSPLYYLGTRPHNEIHEFTTNTRWTSNATTTILFVSEPDHFLKSIQADGSGLKTIVPFPMTDYLVSSNLNFCLFRGTNNNLYFYRRDTGKTNLIWQTTERFLMDQIAFSPSGKRVVFASAKEKTIQIVDLATGKRKSLSLAIDSYDTPTCAWFPDESKFYVDNAHGAKTVVTMDANGDAIVNPLNETNALPTLTCYGRIGKNVHWFSGDDWGAAFSYDTCGDLQAASEPGLGSSLRISEEKSYRHVLTVAVNPGMLHLGDFGFGDVGFLDDCNECVFEANGYLYLLDIKGKRLGTLTEGDRFIRLALRFAK